LLRVFQQEMNNQQRLEQARKVLMSTGPCEASLFDYLDYDSKGFLVFAGVENFIRSKHRSLITTKVERAWRRLQPDNEGRVHYRKFLKAIRPTYFYESYTSHYLSNRSMSPNKKGKKSHRPKSPQRHGITLDATIITNAIMKNSKLQARMAPERNMKKNNSYDVLEESYKQAVERQMTNKAGSPIKRLAKVPKKYYSRNVNRLALEDKIERSCSNSPKKNELREIPDEIYENRHEEYTRSYNKNQESRLSKNFLSATPNYLGDQDRQISSIKRNQEDLEKNWSANKVNNVKIYALLNLSSNKEQIKHRTETTLIESKYYTKQHQKDQIEKFLKKWFMRVPMS